MMSEKIVTMGIGLIVSIFVARYLGPENFGILSYAASLTSLFAISTHLGLHGLAIREIVKYPEDDHQVLGTVFGLKMITAIIATIAFILFAIYTTKPGNEEFWVLCLMAGVILFKPFQVFDFWFQAKVKAKYSSIARGINSLVLALVKIVLVVFSATLLAFAFTYLLSAVLIALLFLFFYKSESNTSLFDWDFNLSRAKHLLSQGWMIMAGSFFAILYLKVDQVMLRWLVNAEEVGVYSVAATLSEAWYFIPGIIVASLFPKLIELRDKSEEKFKLRLQHLFDILSVLALFIAIFITLIADPAIHLLYGLEFQQASVILSIHIWAGIFIFMRAVFSKWILIEDAIAFSMLTHGAGAIANVILNLILIPGYGGVGAAVSTLLSYAMASYISLLFYKKSRPLFWMMSKSLVAPIRYSIKYFCI
nr:flippase [Rhodohalobacter sulfatireducens]